MKINTNDVNEYLRKRHLDEGRIFIDGAIGEYTVETFRDEIDEIVRDIDYHIRIEINSPGGSVFDALAIYDIIRLYKERDIIISVTACGLAASAACMVIMQAASEGERVATKNTRLMIHQPKEWSIGRFEPSDAEDRATELRKVSNQLLGIISERTGKSIEELNKIMERKDIWMSAEEALEFGLIDQII